MVITDSVEPIIGSEYVWTSILIRKNLKRFTYNTYKTEEALFVYLTNRMLECMIKVFPEGLIAGIQGISYTYIIFESKTGDMQMAYFHNLEKKLHGYIYNLSESYYEHNFKSVHKAYMFHNQVLFELKKEYEYKTRKKIVIKPFAGKFLGIVPRLARAVNVAMEMEGGYWDKIKFGISSFRGFDV